MEQDIKRQCKFIPCGNRVLLEVEFEATPIVYNSDKEFSAVEPNWVKVLAVGDEVKNFKGKVGDEVFIYLGNAHSKTIIPAELVGSDRPSLKKIMDRIKGWTPTMRQNSITEKIKSYAWFTVAEFDIVGIIADVAKE